MLATQKCEIEIRLSKIAKDISNIAAFIDQNRQKIEILEAERDCLLHILKMDMRAGIRQRYGDEGGEK